MVLQDGIEVDLVDVLLQLVHKAHDDLLDGAALRLQADSLIEIDQRIATLSSLSNGTLRDKDHRKKLLHIERFFQKVPVLRVSVPRTHPPLRTPLVVNLRVFSGLSSLEINRIPIDSIVGLGGLHLQLRKLKARSAELTSVSQLLVDTLERDKIKVNTEVFWRSLDTLDCRGNAIDKMDETFLHLKSLRILTLSNNQISVLENLQNLHKLEFLDLARNKITSALDFWRFVGNITVLSLAYNQLDSTKGFELIMGLQELDLRGNLIIDPNGVSYLGHLPLLTDLWLEGNPISAEKNYYATAYSFFHDARKRKLTLDDRVPSGSELLQIQEIKRSRNPQATLQRDFEDTTENSDPEFHKNRRKTTVVHLEGGTESPLSAADRSGPQRPLRGFDDADFLKELEGKGTPDGDDFEDVDLNQRKSKVTRRTASFSSTTATHTQLPMPPLPQQAPPPALSNLLGVEFQKKVEALKQEGGNSWLSIFREMQVVQAEDGTPAPALVTGPPTETPAPADSSVLQPGTPPKVLATEDYESPSVGEVTTAAPQEQSNTAAAAKDLPQKMEEAEASFLSLLTAHSAHAIVKESEHQPLRPSGLSKEIGDFVPVPAEVKGKCMMCSSVFFKQSRSESAKKRRVHCPQCDSDYVVDFPESLYTEKALKEAEEADADDDDSNSVVEYPQSESPVLKIRPSRKNLRESLTALDLDSDSDSVLHHSLVDDTPHSAPEGKGLMGILRRSGRSVEGLSRIDSESSERKFSFREPGRKSSLRESEVAAASATSLKAGTSPKSTTLEQVFSEYFDANEHDIPARATEKDGRVVLHPNMLLYFDLKLFKDSNEKLVFFLHTTFVTHSKEPSELKERGVYLLISTHRLYFLNTKLHKSGGGKARPNLVEPERHFRLSTDPLSFEDLYRIDVGLGNQSLTFHFKAPSSMGLAADDVDSFTFLLRDARITAELLDRLVLIAAHLPAKKLPDPPSQDAHFFGTFLGSGDHHPSEPPKRIFGAAVPFPHELELDEEGCYLNPFFPGYVPRVPQTLASSPQVFPASVVGEQYINFDVTGPLQELCHSVVIEMDPASEKPLDKFLLDYTIVQQISQISSVSAVRAIATTDSWLYLITENHMHHPQFFPEMRAPSKRFLRTAVRPLFEVYRVEVVEGPFFRARVVFEAQQGEADFGGEITLKADETPYEPNVWDLQFASSWSQHRFLSLIRRLWREQYQVSLDVVEVSLEDD